MKSDAPMAGGGRCGRMLLLQEREDLQPECPHCGIALDRLYYHRIRPMITARRIYFCPECRKVLGVSHDGNPWMGI
jgi:DNA-directed RNA polymerase subunit RPC12/RpoP